LGGGTFDKSGEESGADALFCLAALVVG